MTRIPTMARIVSIAGLYYVAGRLGLLLAIPPGYATAVWPPSGIALAGLVLLGYRVWPGVLLGSFCLNVGTSFDAASTSTMLRSILVPIGIGTGAALQALAGAYWIRRWVGAAFASEKDVAKFLILGAMAGCLVSATIGVTSLLLGGVIPAAIFPRSWWTWWVGDTIGVIIFTPLVFCWFAKPREVWRRRRISVALPLCISFLLAVVVFSNASRSELRETALEFQQQADVLAQAVKRNLHTRIEAIQGVASFCESAGRLDRRTFRSFTSRSLSRLPGIQALEWIPRVPDSTRAAFEATAFEEWPADFQIHERSANGIAPAIRRSEYFPVQYVEPVSGNEAAVGFDLASQPDRLVALERARDEGEAIATAPIRLVQGTGGSMGFLVLVPVYAGEGRPATLQERRSRLRGFALGTFRFGTILEESLRDFEGAGIELHMYDDSEPDHDWVAHVHETDAGLQISDGSPSDGNTRDPEEANPSGLEWATPIRIAGRQWRLECTPTLEYVAARESWAVWTVLAGGLLFTGLLGAFLLVVTGRTFAVEGLVAEATAELSRTNERLARSNTELEQFAYVASHDLQEPLRMVSSYVQLLGKRYKDKLDQDANEFIDYAVAGTERMRRLIQDLLTYSRLGQIGKSFEPTDCNAVLERVLGDLGSETSETNVVVTHDPLPTIRANGSQLGQLFQNLIGNAIKFRGERDPRIHVSARRDGPDGWVFGVRDNGIGIDPEYRDRIFVIFQRLHGRDRYPGTGIGLAVCKKIVEHHGGRIWCESSPGEGTTFNFTFWA